MEDKSKKLQDDITRAQSLGQEISEFELKAKGLKEERKIVLEELEEAAARLYDWRSRSDWHIPESRDFYARPHSRAEFRFADKEGAGFIIYNYCGNGQWDYEDEDYYFSISELADPETLINDEYNSREAKKEKEVLSHKARQVKDRQERKRIGALRHELENTKGQDEEEILRELANKRGLTLVEATKEES